MGEIEGGVCFPDLKKKNFREISDLHGTVLAGSSMDTSLADGVRPVADGVFTNLIVVLY